MSKSFKQLEKYYYESLQSAENYGFNYKTAKILSALMQR